MAQNPIARRALAARRADIRAARFSRFFPLTAREALFALKAASVAAELYRLHLFWPVVEVHARCEK